MAEVLGKLGSTHALVIHGNDGLDEITLGGSTQVWELNGGIVTEHTISPQDVGIEQTSLSNVQANSVEKSAKMLRGVVDGVSGPARDIVLMNAAAALVASDKAASIKDGVAMAAEAIDSGKAKESLESLIALSQKLD